MKVFLVVIDVQYEGCNPPEAAFSTKRKAQKYIDTTPLKRGDYRYEINELIVDRECKPKKKK